MSAKAINKIESVQKRALRFLFLWNFSYESKKIYNTFQRLRYLCAEIYRTVIGVNPSFMKNVFKKSYTLRLKQTQY